MDKKEGYKIQYKENEMWEFSMKRKEVHEIKYLGLLINLCVGGDGEVDKNVAQLSERNQWARCGGY